MTTTTDAPARWSQTVVLAVAGLIVAGMIHLLSYDVTWWRVIVFVLATTLVATGMFVLLRSRRIVMAILIGAAAVYASRSFLSSGLINVLDVGLLLADDVVAPFIATALATLVLAWAVMIALEARRRIWFVALLAVIAAVTIPMRFPDLV